MIAVIPVGGRKYAAATPMCCGFSAPRTTPEMLKRVAARLQWSSPEDFSLNVLRMQAERERAASLSIESVVAPLEGFIAQRDAFTNEMLSFHTCHALHKTTTEQMRRARDRYGIEAERAKTNNPALAKWFEKMQRQTDEGIAAREKRGH